MDIQTQIDAAHALVQLANGDSSIHCNELCSPEMKNTVKEISGTNDLSGKSGGDDRIIGDSHSNVAGRKLNSFVKHQQDCEVLDCSLSVIPKRKKRFKKLSSLEPQCMKYNVMEMDDSVYEDNQIMDGPKPTEDCLQVCPDRLDMGQMLITKSQENAVESYQERETVDVAVLATLPLNIQGFKLVVPTVDTGFPFSVIHLLTAIRRAMVSPYVEADAVTCGNDQGQSKSEAILTNSRLLPWLTLNNIVERVRSNPMDPRILHTQEPLHDLVAEVLELFSSERAPLGMQGWVPLAFYHKYSNSWSWIGPICFNSRNAWILPDSMLVKLVESFSMWKTFQERLCHVERLPPPPQAPTNVTYRKGIISPSSEKVRALFRKEEALRYVVAERVFFYTALDGRKSAVAPIRKKGKSGYRNHFILKENQPCVITVLCLVRDAAARLPGRVGTRGDMATLLRDSQYIVELVSDERMNQAVKSSLFTLKCQDDPCVKFDKDRQLWVYLHGNRGEEDFDDGGKEEASMLSVEQASG